MTQIQHSGFWIIIVNHIDEYQTLIKNVLAHDQVYINDFCFEMTLNPTENDTDVTFYEAEDYCTNLNGTLMHENQTNYVRVTSLMFIYINSLCRSRLILEHL